MADTGRAGITIVTGGAAGIGRATSDIVASRGSKIVIFDTSPERVEKAVSEISEFASERPVGLTGDISSESSRNELAELLAREGLPVTGLVHCAAMRGPATIEGSSVELWTQVLAVNLVAPSEITRIALPYMRMRGASVVNVSSANAEIGRGGMGPYDASKAALASLTRTMACEFAEDGIRVNSVLPGQTWTDFQVEKALASGGLPDVDPTTPNPAGPALLKRRARPEELAKFIAFLLSDEASYCTGGEYFVDGGLSVGTST